MIIQIDTREHKFEVARIQRQIEREGVETFLSKLDVGDYMDTSNPTLSIDRKKNLQELCSNVTQQHERFKRELIRAVEHGVHLVILIEHGPDIQSLEDVYFWDNPRREKSPKATSGAQLYKSLCTMHERYGVEFAFCDKKNTGKKIIEILKGAT